MSLPIPKTIFLTWLTITIIGSIYTTTTIYTISTSKTKGGIQALPSTTFAGNRTDLNRWVWGCLSWVFWPFTGPYSFVVWCVGWSKGDKEEQIRERRSELRLARLALQNKNSLRDSRRERDQMLTNGRRAGGGKPRSYRELPSMNV